LCCMQHWKVIPCFVSLPFHFPFHLTLYLPCLTMRSFIFMWLHSMDVWKSRKIWNFISGVFRLP
jgi:hypothetical protein